MSLIEALPPCACGCTAWDRAARDVFEIQADALELIGAGRISAEYIASAIARGGLFSTAGRTRPERWTA